MFSSFLFQSRVWVCVVCITNCSLMTQNFWHVWQVSGSVQSNSLCGFASLTLVWWPCISGMFCRFLVQSRVRVHAILHRQEPGLGDGLRHAQAVQGCRPHPQPQVALLLVQWGTGQVSQLTQGLIRHNSKWLNHRCWEFVLQHRKCMSAKIIMHTVFAQPGTCL